MGRRARRRRKRETSRAFEGVFIDSTTGTGVGQIAIITISNLPSTTASSHQALPGLPTLPTYQPTCGGKAGSKGSKANNPSGKKGNNRQLTIQGSSIKRWYGAGVLMVLVEISGMPRPVCLEAQTFHFLTRAWKELFFWLVY